MLAIFIMEIIGINKAISTSKIKKITAIKKNWILKGSRAEFMGSNPHSNGEFFSRSMKDFLDRILANNITMMDRAIIIKLIVKVIINIYTKNS